MARIMQTIISIIKDILQNKNIIYSQIRGYIYFLIIINVFRTLIAYKCKMEANAMANCSNLAMLILYDKTGDMARFTLGNITEISNSKRYKEADIQKNDMIGKKIISRIVSEDLYINMFMFSIYIFITSLILIFIHYKILYIGTHYFGLIFINLINKMILVQNNLLRNCIDTYSKLPVNLISSIIQVSIPILLYRTKYIITLEKIALISCIAAITIFTYNKFICEKILGEKITIKKAHNLKQHIKNRLQIMPGIAVKNMSIFIFVEMLTILSLLSPKENLIDNIFIYTIIRNLIGIHDVPLSTCLRISSSHISNKDKYISSSIMTILILSAIYLFLLPVIIKANIVSSLFYSPRPISNYTHMLTIITVGITSSYKSIESTAMIYNTKIYSTALFLTEIGTIVAYNMLCYIQQMNYKFEIIPTLLITKSIISLLIYSVFMHTYLSHIINIRNKIFQYISSTMIFILTAISIFIYNKNTTIY